MRCAPGATRYWSGRWRRWATDFIHFGETQLEHESHHHHHPHGTGVRWLDLILAIAATIVSLVSLWLGLHSAHSMEKLVMANSYPYLELSSSNAIAPEPGTDRMRANIEFTMINDGVGPARIEWVQLSFKGKPMRDLDELLDACCTDWKTKTANLNMRGTVAGNLVRPGGHLTMFNWPEPATPNPVFTALHRQIRQIEYSACYCSVFEECYVRTSEDNKPQAVEHCPAPKVEFRPGMKGA